MQYSAEREATLDECVDCLIHGEDWTMALADEPSRAQIDPLMEVAQRLLTLARLSPTLEIAGRERIWSRLTRRLRTSDALASVAGLGNLVTARLLAANELVRWRHSRLGGGDG